MTVSSISYTALIFMTYSILGWLMDVLIHFFRSGHLKDRGFFFGPWSPVFGLGMTVIVGLSGSPVTALLLCLLTAILLYWLTDFLLQKLFGLRLSRDSGNIKVLVRRGLLYGLLGWSALYGLHPFILKIIAAIPGSVLRFITNALIALFLLDILFSLNGLSNLYKVLRKVEKRIHLGKDTNLKFLDKYPWQYKLHLLDSYEDIEFIGFVHALAYIKQHRASSRPARSKYIQRLKKNTAAAGRGALENLKAYFNYHHLFWVFIIAGVLGYIVEMIFCVVTRGVVESRQGLLYGPFSQVYGLAAVVMVLCLKPLQYKNDRWLFVGSAIIGGLFEVLCSLVQEKLFGSVSWDYSARALGILGGRTSLVYTLFWGILGTVFIKDIHPRFTKVINYIPQKQGLTLTSIVTVLICVDIVLSCLAVDRWYHRSVRDAAPKNRVEEFLDAQYPDEYLRQIYPNLQMLE